MDTLIWIVTGAAAKLVLVAVTLTRTRGTRRLDKKRGESCERRRPVQKRIGTAGEQTAAPKQEPEGPRRHKPAAGALRRADDVNRTRDEFENACEFDNATEREESYSARSAPTAGDRQAA